MEKLKVILKKIFTEELRNRIKSYVWRGAMFILAIAIKTVADNLNLFELSANYTILLGLFLGECSKYLQNKYNIEGKTLKFFTTNNETGCKQ